jgi:hypothetical protein
MITIDGVVADEPQVTALADPAAHPPLRAFCVKCGVHVEVHDVSSECPCCNFDTVVRPLPRGNSMLHNKLLASLISAIDALPADERSKAIHDACHGLHALEHRQDPEEVYPADKTVLLADLDLDTLKRFHSHPREHWLEGAAVGKLLEGLKLGVDERDLLERFAGRQQEKWPRTCEALLRVLA